MAPNEQPSSSFRPAAWRWHENTWREVGAKPSSYYGERAILRQVACRGNDFAALGGASGGAHGNLRITTWFSSAGGELTQNPLEDFELFGGGSAIGVEEMVAFPGGYVMAGNWLHPSGRAGPAVWFSADGRAWQRLPEDPALASTGEVTRHANGIVALGQQSNGLLLIGEERKGGKDMPFAATSSDGKGWIQEAIPGEGSLLNGSATTLAAWHGSRIDAWRRVDSRWQPSGGFDPGQGPQPPRITGVTGSLIGSCGGKECGLWRYQDGKWTALKAPTPLAATPTSAVLLAGDGKKMLLTMTDGNNLRMYLAESLG
ncbi:MAG TPA: hypothetical protein DGT23_21110 [Micromonosporaceae bacterium]|nr:hypothetical protein [Micromonosporaceae bacterium]